VHVTELISESIGLMRPLAAARGIEIDNEPGHQTTNRFVRADLRRLKQVLLNLLSNAIKYNRRDGRIVVSVLLAGETHLRIAVTDTGMGIQPEHMPRLFSPFDRLGQLATDVEGTGLGLALSQRLTNLMGGRIDAESSPGNGSTFTVTMPLTDAPEPPPPPHTPTGRPHASTRLSTVLYIEDNPSNVDLLAGILCRRPGWSLTHAGTGGLGLELAGTTEPTVILLDLHLPDIKGLAVIRALQANPDTARIPVAVLSADATSAQVRRLLDAGAEEYFTKPIDVAEIFAFLDSHAR
jgi:CheY-like chemotaxis protein/anti-sigma regulatory factor (Ser/Thr protein kinase)